MGEMKLEAIRSLDEALDREIVYYAGKFAREPDLRVLGILDKLVTVDMYADKFLEEHETVAAVSAAVK